MVVDVQQHRTTTSLIARSTVEPANRLRLSLPPKDVYNATTLLPELTLLPSGLI